MLNRDQFIKKVKEREVNNMKRKGCMLLSIMIVLQLLLSCVVTVNAAEEGTEYVVPDSPAVTYNMNIDWKYKRADDSATFPLAAASAAIAKNGKQFYDVDYDDTDWETVSVPHAVNAEDSFDGAGSDAGEASLYRGFMFYRKHISIPESDNGKKLILEFEAVRQSLYLYVNGEMVGYYEAGVAPIGFDITDFVNYGGDNVIAVATDNASSRGSSFETQETIPGHEPGDLSGSFYQWNTKDFNEVQGGLTGNVILYAKNKIYQTLPLYNNLKTTGNYIYGSNFDFRENSADINVEAEVRNETDEERDITLEVNVVDSDGILVSTFSKTETVFPAMDTETDQFLTTVPENAYNEAGEGQENNSVSLDTVEVTKINASANVSELHFWSDVSPYLYTVYTVLKDGEEVIDVQETVTGFREVVYDKDKGLQINGTPTYLKGYAQRSTNEWAAIGVANDWLEDVDMQLIKESNANFIRWMHVAPKPNAIRSGDKYGVISVAPAGDKEGDVSGRQWDQRVEAMRDVIIYYRNSPSVIFYEAGNNQITADHMREMTTLKNNLDPNGYRFMGCRTINSPDQIKEAEWAGTMIFRHDENAYAAMQSTGNYIPMLETEYHRNEAPRRVWDDYSPPYYDYVNKWLGADGSKTDGYDIWDQTQEDFSRTMFNSGDGYSYYYNNRVGGTGKNYYTGAAMMVWSDSNMHARNCGVENARTSGRVDPVRIKKESFYAIQAAQSDTPALHILGHWNYPEYIEGDTENGNYWYEDKTFNGTYWEPNGTMLQRDPTKKTVYVIGSEDVAKVELYVNGELVGTDTKADDNYIYAFDNIDVTQSGSVSAKAYNELDEVIANDEIVTAGEPARIKLTPVTGPDGLIADGSDIAYVDVEIVDEDGNVCPLDERKINFTLNGNGVFLGGYNSGVDERIVNHKDYVYAECGVNRVFIRSTQTSGTITLTASAEGMQPVDITIETTPLELDGGLTTQLQRSFEQGEVPDPPAQETAPELKSLGSVFTADWNEETGNVVKVNEDEKDYYTVTVNGEEVSFTDKAYKPDSNTGVVGEVNPILDAVKAAGGDFTYSYNTEGSIPSYAYGELPYITINTDENTVDIVNVATDIFINGERNLTNFGVAPNSNGTALMAELSAVLGQLPGVSFSTDAESKTLVITVDDEAISLMSEETPALEFSDNKVTVSSGSKLESANLIMAGYSENGELAKVVLTEVNIEAGAKTSVDVSDEILSASTAKAMLWSSDMKYALCEAIKLEENEPQETQEPETTPEPGSDNYDTVAFFDSCDTAAANLVLSEDTSPDGTKYLTNESYEGKSAAGCCFGGLSENSKADIMWEADVRFNTDGSGITPYDNGDKKLGTCVRRHDVDGTPMLSIQTGGDKFENYIEIDPAKWYHIVLIGRFSAPDAATNMIVYGYEGSEMKHLGTFENVNQRNLSANTNNGASHWNVHIGTSVDNLKITMLGADALSVSSNSSEITAGNVMQFTYDATRQGAYITKPAVTWEVYNSDNSAPLNDASITIDSAGVLSVGIDAAEQNIYVRATAESGISASKKISVKAVDISGVKFDTLTLSAAREYVSADEPLTISAAASKNGEAVSLSENDLIWYVCDKDNMRSLGDELNWIKVENGVLSVDTKAISQDITIRAADPTDAVRGSLSVHIKSSDALEGNEDGDKDKLLYADSCEGELTNAVREAGAPDGTSAFRAESGLTTGNITETASDLVIEMDIKFNQEGAGFQPAKNGKLNTCVIYHNGQLAVQTGGSSYTNYGEISPNKWYHITIIRKMESYAHIIFEEYDDNGNRINRKLIKDVNQRNDEPTAFVNINAGTSFDNLRILRPVPTDISVSTDVATVFPGGKVQASATLYWNSLEMKKPASDMLEFMLYDSEDNEPLEDSLIAIDSTGLITIDNAAEPQDVYVRAISPKSGKYASAKFTITSSDIITIDKLGVSEDGSRLVKLFVTKNFYYANELTFVAETFDENGAITSVSTKQVNGSAIRMGENEISLGFALPEGFDKTTDTLKIYAVTKLSADTAAEPDGALSAEKTASGVKLTAIPEFDNGSEIAVLVTKAEADVTNISDSDILCFDMSRDIADGYEASWSQQYDGDYIVRVSGKINGVHTVKTATVSN